MVSVGVKVTFSVWRAGGQHRAGRGRIGEGARDAGRGVELGRAQRGAVGDGGRRGPGHGRRRLLLTVSVTLLLAVV